MKPLPSISQFLDEIDPEKTIDRKQAPIDIGSIVLLKAVDESGRRLSQEEKDKLSAMAKSKANLSFQKAYDLFKQINKEEDLLKAIDNNLNEVRIDYLKTHLEALSLDKREKVLAKFPGLKGILPE